MQVSVETTQGLERRVTITVPADKVESEVKNRLQRLAKTQRIDGFRPGKVPVSVIKKRYGAAVRGEVAQEVMQQNFYQAVVQEKLNPAGTPQIEDQKDTDSGDFQFTAVFEVYPEVKIEGLESIKIEKPTAEVTDADLDNMIETLRKQHGKFEAVERAAEDKDQVVMDFEGSIDGEVFEGGKAEDFKLVLGSGNMIPGFEDGIIGLSAGDEKEINVTFPEEYHAENLKGKAAVFKINVKSVEAQVLPEIDADFVKLFGIADGGIEELKAEVRQNMQRELKQALTQKVKENVISGLIDTIGLEVPKALVEQEISALKQQALQRFGNGNQNLPELPNELFQDQAARRVKTGLLLSEIVRSSEIKVDEDKVKETIENLASAYESPEEVVEYYNSNKEMLTNIQNVVMEEQAVDFVLEQAQVETVAKSFDEIMNKHA
ncbi:trigger factor [Catenovulum maritimum]|uniref:Trigger factor n=1 Tax=Catenovulum maritimum TaxID=1513271 RepID=A0A0J8GSG9_9ALTE|nr:trigger factor [Catenovulum maritimum]KMT65745.1 trigger factor [Catenovulum maritimum]